jgi:uncharacterized protein (DUF302 family)
MRIIFALLLALLLQPAFAAQDQGLNYTNFAVQVARIPVDDSVSFDDAVESLKLRANQHNLKFAGVSKVYKEIEALTGKTAKRTEIYSFCDGLTADKMIKAEPLMVSFMPCRIAILEDEKGKRWVISMMIDPKMLQGLPEDARKSAEGVMASMKDMMVAASKGDL